MQIFPPNYRPGWSSAAEEVLGRLGSALCALLLIAAVTPAAAAQGPYADRSFVAHMRSGLDAFYGRDFQKARAQFAAAHALAPGDAFALSLSDAAAENIGSAALRALSESQEAAVVSRPKDAIAQAALGFTYLFERRLDPRRADDAKDALNAAIAIAPALPCAHVGLGVYRLSEGATNRAKLEFLAALHEQPHDVMALEYLAVIYQRDLDDPARALSYVINVPNIMPNYADAYYRLGSIMRDLGQYDAAARYLETAIDLDRGHVGEAGHFGLPLLGDVYLKLHKLAAAKKAFALAIVYGEEPDRAKAELEKIKRGDG
ncbi:MAG: tetratricopeptide repeat protein [Candidatus Eremiobacteraeota bacterium]|nr:tetratricopeptide repeat protein [Candidatus Eremiobacteraeota bacterium]